MQSEAQEFRQWISTIENRRLEWFMDELGEVLIYVINLMTPCSEMTQVRTQIKTGMPVDKPIIEKVQISVSQLCEHVLIRTELPLGNKRVSYFFRERKAFAGSRCPVINECKLFGRRTECAICIVACMRHQWDRMKKCSRRRHISITQPSWLGKTCSGSWPRPDEASKFSWQPLEEMERCQDNCLL